MKFQEYIHFREGKENLDQPHVINGDMKVPEGIKKLAELFKKSKEVSVGKEIAKEGGEKDITLKNKKLYLVGGAVRDYLLGHTPRNYNLVTDAHPEEVAQIIKSAKPPIFILKQDKKNGITKVSLDGEEYEIHTLKKGDVFSTDPAEDCQGRDFTINALYYDIASNKIIDYCGGIRHLKDGNIKLIGQTEEKLKKDGIHKYKMMRFMNTVPNGRIDDETCQALKKSNSEEEETAPEKIREEFLRGLEHAHTNVRKYLKSYEKSGLINKVFPNLEINLDIPDCGTCKNRAIVLAYLLKDNSPFILVKQLKELKYTEREIKDAVYLINLLWFSPDHIYDFKKELLNTGLSKRQILDWAKINDLDKNMIEKLLDYQLQVNHTLGENGMLHKLKQLEAENFKKTI